MFFLKLKKCFLYPGFPPIDQTVYISSHISIAVSNSFITGDERDFAFSPDVIKKKTQFLKNAFFSFINALYSDYTTSARQSICHDVERRKEDERQTQQIQETPAVEEVTLMPFVNIF